MLACWGMHHCHSTTPTFLAGVQKTLGGALAGDVEVLVLLKCHNLSFSDDSLSQHVSVPRSNAIKRHARVLLVCGLYPAAVATMPKLWDPKGPIARPRERIPVPAHPGSYEVGELARRRLSLARH